MHLYDRLDETPTLAGKLRLLLRQAIYSSLGVLLAYAILRILSWAHISSVNTGSIWGVAIGVLLGQMLFAVHYFASRGKHQSALHTLRNQLTTEPANAQACFAKIDDILDKEYKRKHRVQVWEELSRTHASSPWPHYYLARAYTLCTRYDDALASLKKAREIDTESIEIRFAFASALFKCGNLAEALDEFTAIREEDPDNTDARLKIIDVLLELGETEAARTESAFLSMSL